MKKPSRKFGKVVLGKSSKTKGLQIKTTVKAGGLNAANHSRQFASE